MATETVTILVSRDLDPLAWALEQQGKLILRLRQVARRHPSRIIELAIEDALDVCMIIREIIRNGEA